MAAEYRESETDAVGMAPRRRVVELLLVDLVVVEISRG